MSNQIAINAAELLSKIAELIEEQKEVILEEVDNKFAETHKLINELDAKINGMNINTNALGTKIEQMESNMEVSLASIKQSILTFSSLKHAPKATSKKATASSDTGDDTGASASTAPAPTATFPHRGKVAWLRAMVLENKAFVEKYLSAAEIVSIDEDPTVKAAKPASKDTKWRTTACKIIKENPTLSARLEEDYKKAKLEYEAGASTELTADAETPPSN